LAGFTDTGQSDGRLYAFNIERKNWFGSSPGSVGAERGFYDYSENSKPDATADDAFFEFETSFPRIRRELVASNFSGWTKHLDFLVRYSQMLRARSPLFRDEVLKELGSTTLFKLGEVLETRPSPDKPGESETVFRYSEFKPQGSERDTLFKLSITKMREEIKKGAGEFTGWHWCLRLTTNMAAPFITADNAVGLIGSGQKSRDEAMYQTDTIFVFPVCRQACLMGSVKEYEETEAIQLPLLAELHKFFLTRPEHGLKKGKL
jgi:hypothetical protein